MERDLEILSDRENQVMQRQGFLPSVNDAFDQFMDYPFGRMFGEWPNVSRQVSPDIQETDEGYFLTMDVPGTSQGDIDVSISGNLLTVRAERRESEESDTEGYRRQFRKYQQTLALPTTVNSEKIEASCHDGILEVVIPKTAEARMRKIEVKAGHIGDLKKNREKSKH